MNPGGTILNLTPASFGPVVQQSLAPVLLFAYEEPGCETLHTQFVQAARAAQPEALLARANLSQYPELTRSLGCPPAASLTLYWEGTVQYQFFGRFTAFELQELLDKAGTLANSAKGMRAGADQ